MKIKVKDKNGTYKEAIIKGLKGDKGDTPNLNTFDSIISSFPSGQINLLDTLYQAIEITNADNEFIFPTVPVGKGKEINVVFYGKTEYSIATPNVTYFTTKPVNFSANFRYFAKFVCVNKVWYGWIDKQSM